MGGGPGEWWGEGVVMVVWAAAKVVQWRCAVLMTHCGHPLPTAAQCAWSP